MNLKVWLAFGFGLIFGAFGMATLLGCLMLRASGLVGPTARRADELRRETRPAFDQVLRVCGMIPCRVTKIKRANFPRIIIGYFQTNSSTPLKTLGPEWAALKRRSTRRFYDPDRN